MKELNVYLLRLLDSINKIEQYIGKESFDDFLSDEKTVDACLMQLQHMGETAKKLRKYHPNFTALPSREMANIRDFIAHDYLGVDKEIIREVIKDELPPIKQILENLVGDEYKKF